MAFSSYQLQLTLHTNGHCTRISKVIEAQVHSSRDSNLIQPENFNFNFFYQKAHKDLQKLTLLIRSPISFGFVMTNMYDFPCSNFCVPFGVRSKFLNDFFPPSV